MTALKYFPAALVLLAGFLTTTVVAVKTPVDGIGFSGTAMMLPYHIGVVEELIKSGLWVPGETRVAGTSGGSYIAASVTTGTTAAQLRVAVDALMKRMIKFEEDCIKAGGTALECDVSHEKVGPFVDGIINDIIPHDPKKYKRTNDKAYTHITTITVPLPKPEPIEEPICASLPTGNLTVGRYSDRNDLVNALKASSFFSHFINENCTMAFRQFLATDGGYTMHLPCPPRSKACLRVEALVNDQEALKKCDPTDLVVPGGSADADIYPGLGTNNVLPLDPCNWQKASVNVALQQSKFDEIILQGAADTRFWLKQNGWA